MSIEIKDEDKDYYNSSDFKAQINQIKALNIENSSEKNNSSSKYVDFYDDVLDKEQALKIHEALEDKKLEKKFLEYTFLIISIQFAFIFIFSLVGFLTDFNKIFIEGEGESFGIFFLLQ